MGFTLFMTTLTLTRALRDEMIMHAVGLWPEEACGLVAGRDGRGVRFYPIENVHHSPVAFEMEPVQQVRAMLAMEADGLELLAIYHSHPDGPAQPSATDVALAYYPDTVQLILSLADRAHPTLRAFTIVDGVIAKAEWEEEEATDVTDFTD